MAKVGGIFLDYDGTISPLDVSRELSRIPHHLETLLNILRRYIPIGIISTKDIHFILPRTLFAYAWGAIAGLEMRIGSQLFVSQGVDEAQPLLNQTLKYAREHLRAGGIIEEKRSYSGQPLAFCVDWRQMRNEKEARAMSAELLNYCLSSTLNVVKYDRKPYFDVFPCHINKGKTLRKMEEKVMFSGNVLYMGDSVTDNPAFLEADISIGVTSGRKPLDLACQYWISFDEVACFLSHLFKNDFNFSPDLPGIKVRG